MTNREKTSDEKLEVLLDTITSDVLNASDEEILAEATSDYGSALEEANRVRMSIRRTVLSSGPQNLDSVKKFYGNTNFEVLGMPDDGMSIRTEFDTLHPNVEYKMVAGNSSETKIVKERSSLTDSQTQKALEEKKNQL